MLEIAEYFEVERMKGMLCDICHKRVAAVHLTQVVNHNKIEMYLCEQCASNNKQNNFSSQASLNDFLSGLMGFSAPEASQYVSNKPQETVCEKCGMSYGDFQKLGKMGCENCYTIFGDKLEPLIKRIHGNLQHHGKVPEKVSRSIKATQELESLKQELNEAVRSEEYEKAAELRDRIRNMEAGGK